MEYRDAKNQFDHFIQRRPFGAVSHSGTLTELLGGWSREGAVQLIGMRQQADILGSIFAGKPLHGALTPLELACLEILLNQAFDLDPGITADLV